MGFAECYAKSVNSTNLMDDEFHFSPEALAASGHARYDDSQGDLGALLCRARYADGSQSKIFESGTRNLAPILRIWLAVVTQKGTDRKWVRISSDWDIKIAGDLYRRIAEASLAYWLDSRCQECKGAAQTPERRICDCCKGTGRGDFTTKTTTYERERIMDMVADLDGILSAYMQRAAAKMRRVS